MVEKSWNVCLLGVDLIGMIFTPFTPIYPWSFSHLPILHVINLKLFKNLLLKVAIQPSQIVEPANYVNTHYEFLFAMHEPTSFTYRLAWLDPSVNVLYYHLFSARYSIKLPFAFTIHLTRPKSSYNVPYPTKRAIC